MKRILLLIVCSICFCICRAQTDTIKIEADTTVSVFTKIETEAYFPGGLTAWKNFLEKNLNVEKVTKKAAPKKARQWEQTAYVKFIVEKDGSLSNVTVTNANELHEAVIRECLRVFSIVPKWVPATQNGRKVRSYHTQPLTFTLRG